MPCLPARFFDGDKWLTARDGMEIDTLFLLFFIGAIAGFVGNFISGGTSLIAIVSMLTIGMPPQLAVATQAVGSLGWRLGGLRQFWHANKIVWKLVPPLALVAFVGAWIGSHILVATDPEILNRIVGIVLLLFVPAALFHKRLGVVRQAATPHRTVLGVLLYFLVAVWAGFFTAGAGMLILYVHLFCFGLTILEAKGTDKIPGIFLDVAIIITLALHDVFNPLYALAFCPGMFCGGALGAHYAIRLGDKWLKEIVLVSVLIMAGRLIFM
ncbi:MAG: sulfite exporter TauE/SafE family protein [Alphaproteobacteria bacterium]